MCTEELASRPQALGRDCGLSGTETSVGHPSRTEVQALESHGWEAQARREKNAGRDRFKASCALKPGSWTEF